MSDYTARMPNGERLYFERWVVLAFWAGTLHDELLLRLLRRAVDIYPNR